MADADALDLRIRATITQFERSMDKARRKLNRDAEKMERRAKKMDGVFERVGVNFGGRLKAGIAGLIAGASFGALIRQTEAVANRLDAIAKTADKLGITTDTLQGLRAAAKDSGVAVGTLDTALQRFTRRTAEARQGTGEARGALAELGVSLTDAAGRARPTEELLFDVADAMARVETQSDRVRLAFKLFDTEGVGLVNTLAAGGDALRRLIGEARTAGRVIDESLIRTSEETVTQLGILEDQIDTNLARAFGTTQPLLLAWRKGLEGITGEAASAIEALRSLNGVGSESAANAVDILSRFGLIGASVAGLAGSAGQLARGQGSGAAAGGAINDFILGAVPEAPAPPSVTPPRPPGGGGRGGAGPVSFRDIIADSQRSLAELRAEADRALLDPDDAAAAAEEFRLLTRVAEEYGLSLERAIATGVVPADARAQIEAVAAAYGEANAKRERNARMAEASAAGMEEARRAARDMADEQRRAFESVVDSLSAATVGATSLEDALRRVLVQLVNIAGQGLLGQGPAAGLFKSLAGLGSDSSLVDLGAANIVSLSRPSAAPVTSPLPPLPSFAGGGFTGTGGRAGGLDGQGGFPAVLHPNETVIDHSAAGRAGGGGAGVTITGPTIVIQGDASERTVRLIEQRVSASQRQMIDAMPALMADIGQRSGTVRGRFR